MSKQGKRVSKSILNRMEVVRLTDEQIFEIKAPPPCEGGEIVEEERKTNRLAVYRRKNNLKS